MTALFWLALTVLTLLNGLGVTVDHEPLAGSSLARDAYGLPRVAATYCRAGSPVVYYSPAMSPEWWLHEYIHALDCADDGLWNGSPCSSKRPATYAEAVAVMNAAHPGIDSGWVWYAWAGTMGPVPTEYDEAEWCAIMATLTGRLANQEVR